MTCGNSCSEPTWEDFRTHVGIAGASWLAFIAFGLMVGICRQRYECDRLHAVAFNGARIVTTNKWYLWLMGALSMVICVFHVMYVDSGELQSELFEIIICAVHGLEILFIWLRASCASSEDLLSLAGGRLIIDCMIVPSVLLRGVVTRTTLSLSYAASLRIYVLWNLYCGSLSTFKIDARLQLAHELIKLSCGIFFIGAVIMQVETLEGDPWLQQGQWPPVSDQSSPAEIWTMSASAYLVLVTMSTVGYGDLTPKTIFGQVLMIVIIVSGFVVALYTGLGFMEAHRTAIRGGGEYHIHARSRMRRHIVVTGSPSSQMLKDMLYELYHPDHSSESEGLDVVIMLLPGQQGVMENVRRFLSLKSNRRIQSRVWLLQGSPLQRDDLVRVKLPDSSLVYVLPNLHAADNEREDIENTMRALSMHRFAPYVRMITLLMKVEYRDLMLAAGIAAKDIVCIQELKLGLMGKSCEVQGFATCLCNLFRSSDYDFAGDLDPNDEVESWTPDYVRGMSNEIYEARLSPAYLGAPFGEVALDILKRSAGGAYMVGIIEESRYPGDAPIIMLHPGRHYKVGTQEDMLCKGIFVANRRSSISQHPPRKQFSWKMDFGEVGDDDGANLPNMVKESAEFENVNHTTKWLREPKEVKREHAAIIKKSMTGAATQRVAHGLMALEGMSQAEVEDLMHVKLKDHVQEDKGSFYFEDQLEIETDPAKRALLQQQLLVARASEDAKITFNTQVALGTERKAQLDAENAVRAAKKDMVQARDRKAEQEEEYDSMLWGGPPTPLPPLWADPEEPPASLLVKGGHILFLALEGAEGMDETGKSSKEKQQGAGRKLGLEHFVESLRADQDRMMRPVVVLAQRVPYDWMKVADYQDVYLIAGRTLSAENLHRAGLLQAHAVVVSQRGPMVTLDPTLVDAQAIFATVLVESLLAAAGKQLLVMVDLMIDSNCTYVPIASQKPKDEEKKFKVDDDEPDQQDIAVALKDEDNVPYLMQPRFVTGQLFASSSVVTSLVSNMLYNPSLGSLILEMLRVRFVVVPIPRSFRGRNFQQLFEHMMRRKNLVVMALVRRVDESIEEEQDEEDGEEEPAVKKPVNPVPQGEPERWRRGEPPSGRFIYAMPAGDRLVSLRDGVLCIVPRGSRAIIEF